MSKKKWLAWTSAEGVIKFDSEEEYQEWFLKTFGPVNPDNHSDLKDKEKP